MNRTTAPRPFDTGTLMEAARRLVGRFQERGRVHTPVGERGPLQHRIDAMGRGDQRGAVRRDEAAGDRATGFHQFGRQHDIDIARHRHQRQHRLLVACGGFREQLDIIDGGAGTLRDTRHRRHLREIAAMFGEVDDPVGEHAAALPAHGEDRDGDRANARRTAGIDQRGVHAVTIFRSSRRWKKPITASRMRCRKRSHPVGLSMIEAW